MIELFLWAITAAGVIAACVQLFAARKLNLRPVILGSLALIVLLGLLGVLWNGAQAMHTVALANPAEKATMLATRISASIDELMWTSVGLLVISGLGGIGMLVRDLAARKRGAAAAPTPAPAPPATGV